MRGVLVAMAWLTCAPLPKPSTAAAGGVASPTGGAPKNDYLLVLRHRAGPFHYVDSFQERRAFPYVMAVQAFGQPTRSTTEFYDDGHTAGYCNLTWVGPGVTLRLFSFSGWWPPQPDDASAHRIQPCSQLELAHADFMKLRLFGTGWQNTTGLRIGALPPRHRCVARNVGVRSSRAWGGAGRLYLDLCHEDIDGRVAAITVSVAGSP